MGTLGNIVGNAIDAGFGKSRGTTLQDFLSHFSSSEGKWINTIDPFSTFDVKIRFYPPMPTEPVKPSNLVSAIAFCRSAPVLPAFSKACKPKLVAS